MPAPDVSFIAGLDDSQLNAKLKQSTSNVGKALGQSKQLQGIAGLVGSAGFLGVGAGPLALGALGVGAFMRLMQLQDQIADKAADEARERRKGADAARDTAGSLSRALNIDSFGGEALQKREAAALKFKAINDEINKGFELEREATVRNDRFAKYQTLVDVEEGRQEALREVTRTQENVIRQIEREIAATNELYTARTRGAALAAQGAAAESEVVEEMAKQAEAMARIQKMRLDNPAQADAALEAEQLRHASRLDQITGDELERQNKTDEASQRSSQAVEDEKKKAELYALQLRQKTALVEGEKDLAEQLDIQLKDEQRRAEIMGLSNISQEQRQALLEQAKRLNEAELRGIGGGAGKTTSAGSGFAEAGRLAGLAVGGRADRLAEQQVTEQKKTTRAVQQVAEYVKRYAGSPAVFA